MIDTKVTTNKGVENAEKNLEQASLKIKTIARKEIYGKLY